MTQKRTQFVFILNFFILLNIFLCNIFFLSKNTTCMPASNEEHSFYSNHANLPYFCTLFSFLALLTSTAPNQSPLSDFATQTLLQMKTCVTMTISLSVKHHFNHRINHSFLWRAQEPWQPTLLLRSSSSCSSCRRASSSSSCRLRSSASLRRLSSAARSLSSAAWRE